MISWLKLLWKYLDNSCYQHELLLTCLYIKRSREKNAKLSETKEIQKGQEWLKKKDAGKMNAWWSLAWMLIVNVHDGKCVEGSPHSCLQFSQGQVDSA